MATKKKAPKHEYCGKPACKRCWEDYKARTRDTDPRDRAIIIPRSNNRYRGARLHDCPHAKKHHKASGRCRKGCDCSYAMDKAVRKERVAA